MIDKINVLAFHYMQKAFMELQHESQVEVQLARENPKQYSVDTEQPLSEIYAKKAQTLIQAQIIIQAGKLQDEDFGDLDILL